MRPTADPSDADGAVPTAVVDHPPCTGPPRRSGPPRAVNVPALRAPDDRSSTEATAPGVLPDLPLGRRGAAGAGRHRRGTLRLAQCRWCMTQTPPLNRTGGPTRPRARIFQPATRPSRTARSASSPTPATGPSSRHQRSDPRIQPADSSPRSTAGPEDVPEPGAAGPLRTLRGHPIVRCSVKARSPRTLASGATV
jgi:hypothetical protein